MTSFVRNAAALLATAGLAAGSGLCYAGPVPARNVSCNCNQGSLSGGSAGSFAGGMHGPPAIYGEGFAGNPAPYTGDPAPHGPFGAPPVDHGHGPGPIGAGPIGPGSVGPGGPGGPPPGTVGTTYRRATRPVPVDKHPRLGMLTVSAQNATAMAVEGMKGFKDEDGYWHFETKEPLIPGIPHIYHVKARMGEGDGAPIEFRTVRLIPGRIIDLDW